MWFLLCHKHFPRTVLYYCCAVVADAFIPWYRASCRSQNPRHACSSRPWRLTRRGSICWTELQNGSLPLTSYNFDAVQHFEPGFCSTVQNVDRVITRPTSAISKGRTRVVCLIFVGNGRPSMYVNRRTPVSHPITRECRANSHRLRQKFGDAGPDTVRMWLTEKRSDSFQQACRHKFRAKRSLYTEHELTVSQSITKQQRQFKAAGSTPMVCLLSWLATTAAKLTYMPAGAVSDTTAIQTQHSSTVFVCHINHLSGDATKRGTAQHHPKGRYRCPPRQSLS